MAGQGEPGRTFFQRIRPRLPEKLPELRKRRLLAFQLLWVPAFILAVAGPLAGAWYRSGNLGQNSALMLGSRAGIVLSEDDLTHIRFPVGPEARASGIRPGDDIVAIDGMKVAGTVPISERGLAKPNDATDADYAAFTDLVEGTQDVDIDLTVRSRDGSESDRRVRTGERHIEEAARQIGIPPALLSVVDLLHILTYPFLLISAWILHRRKPEDMVSSVLSLAILLTIAAEQPSASFLSFILHMPDWAHRTLYDLGNICLVAGILLFPYGRLRPRSALLVLALLPVLFFLKGDSYRQVFMLFMGAGVLTLLLRLRATPPGDVRQQIKWALFGFAGYALFLTVSLTSDMAKLQVNSFSSQLVLEVLSGLCFGLAFLSLQMGLLVALLRYRLYDAEVVISRSATFALVTLSLAGIFAASMEGVKVVVQNALGQNVSAGSAAIFASAVSTILISPAQNRIQRWAEERFQRNLLQLRRELPDCVRDLREVASLPELLDEVMIRVQAGIRTVRLAILVEGRAAALSGIARDDVEAWLGSTNCLKQEGCDSADALFPIQVPLRVGGEPGQTFGWLLAGPRPDGSSLSKDEREALAEIADPLARALRVVLKRESREREMKAVAEGYQRRIEAIETRLAQPSERVSTAPPMRRVRPRK